MSFNTNRPPGVSYVPSYEISGVPYVTSSAPSEVPSASAGSVKVHFPFVTRWVEVVNTGANVLRVGFSNNGVRGEGAASGSNGTVTGEELPVHRNYFELHPATGSNQSHSRVRWELRCPSMFFAGGGGKTSFSICAGLTTIPANRLIITGSEGFLGIG